MDILVIYSYFKKTIYNGYQETKHLSKETIFVLGVGNSTLFTFLCTNIFMVAPINERNPKEGPNDKVFGTQEFQSNLI